MTTMLEDIVDRCDAIEKCYEFMLAYAAQGLPGDQGSRSGTQLRELLSRAVKAASGLAGAYAAVVRELRHRTGRTIPGLSGGAGAGCRERACRRPTGACSAEDQFPVDR